MKYYNHENRNNSNQYLGQNGHAPFKKVVTFDLICMGLGIMIGIGIGAYLVAGV
jgi:hypothetical protein